MSHGCTLMNGRSLHDGQWFSEAQGGTHTEWCYSLQSLSPTGIQSPSPSHILGRFHRLWLFPLIKTNPDQSMMLPSHGIQGCSSRPFSALALLRGLGVKWEWSPFPPPPLPLLLLLRSSLGLQSRRGLGREVERERVVLVSAYQPGLWRWTDETDSSSLLTYTHGLGEEDTM